jgi:magnesium transporter
MNAELPSVVEQLNLRFLRDHPAVAARRLEELSIEESLDEIGALPAASLLATWPHLATERGAQLLARMSSSVSSALLAGLLPTDATRFLGGLDADEQARLLQDLPRDAASELRGLMSYPDDTAGRLMDTRFPHFRASLSAREALDRLREAHRRVTRAVFVIDDENHLTGHVSIQDLALAHPHVALADLAQAPFAVVQPMDPRDDVIAIAERHPLSELPVVDLDGRLIGVIAPGTLVQALQAEAAAEIGAMVGVSPSERALSKPWFAVKKRLPWLQINLLTAFMAASVVGLFQDTIAKFTALAVLMPVVAGQSGNAGAQAQAVTMRGLALREVTARQWLAVTTKEVWVALMNGVSVAITCGLGVWLWSGSLSLVMVISSSMVLAMMAAGFAGAMVPMTLTRLGQDPAQSSSIVLTTITDISGFLSFLGIATLMSSHLQAG